MTIQGVNMSITKCTFVGGLRLKGNLVPFIICLSLQFSTCLKSQGSVPE